MGTDHDDLAWAAGGFGIALAAWAWEKRRVTRAANFQVALTYATRWAKAFPQGADLSTILAVMRRESSYDASLPPNMDERAAKRGGAWGLMGMTAETAAELSSAAMRLPPTKTPWTNTAAPLVTSVFQKIRGVGLPSVLSDPDVNTFLGVLYLNRLVRTFGNDPALVVAAYHSGPGPALKAVREGRFVAEFLGPHGKEYLADVLRYKAELEEGKA